MPANKRLQDNIERDIMDKPFILFCGFTYYPAPGWQGYIGDFETLEQACESGIENSQNEYDWWQVVDLDQKKIVAGEGEGHTGLFGKFPANPQSPLEETI